MLKSHCNFSATFLIMAAASSTYSLVMTKGGDNLKSKFNLTNYLKITSRYYHVLVWQVIHNLLIYSKINKHLCVLDALFHRIQ